MKPEYTSEAMAKAAGFDTEYVHLNRSGATKPNPSPTHRSRQEPLASSSAPLTLAQQIYPHLRVNEKGKPK